MSAPAGIQNNPLYFYYTDQSIKINPSIMPTSILITDESVIKEIVMFSPKFILYNVKSEIDFSNNSVSFLPTNKVVLE